MKKILFVAPLRPNRSPSQRFRFEQYIEYLKQNGYDCKYSYLVSENDDKVFYSKGNVFKKALLQIKYFFKRLDDVAYAKKCDIVYVQREAFFLGSTYFEKQFAKYSKLVFDFDDSIWISNVSEANKRFSWLKNYRKTVAIISCAQMVFAGNKYLCDYALQYNNNVKIIPTTIDTTEYCKKEKHNSETINIGWSGSITTIQHFEFAISFLKEIKKKYKDKVNIIVIGDGTYRNEELDIKGIAWNKSTELNDLSCFDIGIMPLPDDEWANGKCGLKGLQYMALEIPTIMSPVGVNTEIIQDGKNGFLAKNNQEWIDKIEMLINSKQLRDDIGKNGRQTVLEKYSVQSQKDRYLQFFNELCSK